MTVDLKKPLDIKTKIDILHYLKGKYRAAHIGNVYELKGDAPSEKPDAESWYISSVLGLDFEEFYHNDPEAYRKCKLYNDELKEKLDTKWWFIGDILTGILFDALSPIDNRIDEQKVKQIDRQLIDVYQRFQKVGQPENDEKNLSFHYIPSGVFFNGEELYRRIDS